MADAPFTPSSLNQSSSNAFAGPSFSNINNNSTPVVNTGPTFAQGIAGGVTAPTTPQNLLSDKQPVFDSLQPKQQQKSGFDSGSFVEQKYNEQTHYVQLYLDNGGDLSQPSDKNRYYINPSAILGMTITDTVTNWVVEGSLTFMYLPEKPPSNTSTKTKQSRSTAIDGAIANAKMLEQYDFRNDGFDLLRVMIVPKSTSVKGGLGISVDQSDTKWTLSYVFSVYDIEDVNDVPDLKGNLATYMKCLKLKFRDVRHHILNTTNLEYSTAMPKDTTISSNFASGMTNEGVLYTGDAIRDVFNAALTNLENGGNPEFEVLDSPRTWDKGASEIFYTSPAQSSALDDIEYLFAHHSSSIDQLQGTDEDIKDLCLLHTNRPEFVGGIEPIVLTSLQSIFKEAGKDANAPGELQKEHFFITATTDQVETASQVMHKAPIGGDGKNKDFKSAKYGQIISYSFVDMSPAINSNAFISTPVYSVDIGKRIFNMKFKSNDVLSARKAIAKSYISNLYKSGSDEEQLFLTTIHTSKKDLNVFPTFSLNGDMIPNGELLRQRNGIHQLLYTGLFQNACICFKVYGLTLRESGTFIGIDKTDGCAESDYNNKLYGQWFVVKVDHLFEAGAYMNIIYAVKIHRHTDKESKFKQIL